MYSHYPPSLYLSLNLSACDRNPSYFVYPMLFKDITPYPQEYTCLKEFKHWCEFPDALISLVMVQGVSRGDTEGELLPGQESLHHRSHREAGQPSSVEDVSLYNHCSQVRTAYQFILSPHCSHRNIPVLFTRISVRMWLFRSKVVLAILMFDFVFKTFFSLWSYFWCLQSF